MQSEIAELDREIGFEVLISDILSLLINMPDAQMDAGIEDAIQEIAEFLGLDQGLLVQWTKDETLPLLSHSWTVTGGEAPPLSPGTEVVPWVHGQTVQGEIVMFSALDELPEEAERDREFFRTSGRKSLISLPIKIEGRISGALVFASLHSEVPWPADVVRKLQLVSNVLAGVLQRQQNRLELAERLRFEMLLAETSLRLINLPADRLDEEILKTLRHICESLDLDHSTIWLLTPGETGTMHLEYLYDKEGLSVPAHLDAKLLFPWPLDKVMAGEVLAVSKLSDVPADGARDRDSWRFYGTGSSLVVPLSAGGSVFGAVSFAVVRREREWPEPIINRLKLVAQILSICIAHRHAERAMRESWARLNLAADSANAALWTAEMGSGHIWTVEKARKLLGAALNQELNLEAFLSIIHPEDSDRIREKLQRTVRTGEDFSDEYRVIQPDGAIRWMAARGRLHHDGGGPDRLIGASLDITERKQMEGQLCERLREIGELKKRLEDENVYLQEEVRQLTERTDIVGQSAAIKKVLVQATQVARTDTSVLIQGETGTGKELLARWIHDLSMRKNHLLVTVNCAALPPSLIESELFGREKGAYTGALTRMAGRFEVADGSTLFLDEIGELPIELQGKLLRVIEEGCFERLGSTDPIRVSVRLIAATNRDLAREVEEGRFRRDLFYRLNVFPIVIPPLRERPEDIPLLVWSFVAELQKKMGKRIEHIPRKTIDMLQSYEWPGNGRELRNVIERAMIVSSGKTLEVLLPKPSGGNSVKLSLQEMERRHIMDVLEKTSWRVTGKEGAAEILGLKGTTLQSKMKKLGIERPVH
jgi:formate hydrogenlyase transcriptional activator